MLGIRPALGRLFVKEEDATLGAHPVALISHAMWQKDFGGAADVIGQTLLLNGERVEIVGVAQKGFTDLHLDPVDVWLPAALASDMGLILGGAWRTSTGMAAISYVGRLSPGASEEAALAQSTAALRHAAEAEPSLDSTPEVRTTSLALASSPGGTGAESVSLWLVLVAGLVLIIACANVVNLLLTRAITRRRELSVRLALGAGRWRVARQHLTESLMLALLGGAAGVALAYAGVRLLGQFPLPRTAGEVDARLLLFALLVSLLTGLLFGVFPAVRSVQLDPVQGLRDTRAAGSIARSRTRRALVVVQVSLSLALLVGAGLFIRSLREVNAIDGGVDLDRLLTASVDLRRAGYSEAEREDFYARALARLSILPSVERAAIIHFEPFSGSGMSVMWDVPGREAPDGTEGPYLNMAGVGYFETAGTRLLAGRTFDETDRSGGEPVAVLNEAMAWLMADDGNMVGRCVPLGDQVGGSGCTRIIGIVETQQRYYLDDKPVPVVFLSRAQAPNAIWWGGPTLLVRTRGKPAHDAPTVRAAVQGLSEGLPYVKVQPLEELIRRDIMPYRLGARLFSLFGLLALALAALGLYGVLSYFVMERTAEIGIRRSLGAPAGGVVALVIRQGMIPVTVGVLAGMAAAFAGTRFLSAMLFGVDARDPLVFSASAAFLLVVALIASLVPAMRAARVSPMVALRID
jgi:predicted permease